MTYNLATLKAAAEKATPGPWLGNHNGMALHSVRSQTTSALIAHTQAGDMEGYDMRFISRADPSTVLALIADLERMEAALKALCDKLDAVHADGSYQSVWTLNQLHYGPYTGPSYADELASARTTLTGGKHE